MKQHSNPYGTFNTDTEMGSITF